MCLGNDSVDFSANNMIKTGLYGSVYDFFVDFSIINTSNIIDIQKYLMKKHNIKWYLDLLRRFLLQQCYVLVPIH